VKSVLISGNPWIKFLRRSSLGSGINSWIKRIQKVKLMKRIAHKTTNYLEAEKYDIKQQVSMTPAERMAAARQLKIRFYGNKTTDVKEWQPKQ
jgi:hypothetical protein